MRSLSLTRIEKSQIEKNDDDLNEDTAIGGKAADLDGFINSTEATDLEYMNEKQLKDKKMVTNAQKVA